MQFQNIFFDFYLYQFMQPKVHKKDKIIFNILRSTLNFRTIVFSLCYVCVDVYICNAVTLLQLYFLLNISSKSFLKANESELPV